MPHCWHKDSSNRWAQGHQLCASTPFNVWFKGTTHTQGHWQLAGFLLECSFILNFITQTKVTPYFSLSTASCLPYQSAAATASAIKWQQNGLPCSSLDTLYLSLKSSQRGVLGVIGMMIRQGDSFVRMNLSSSLQLVSTIASVGKEALMWGGGEVKTERCISQSVKAFVLCNHCVKYKCEECVF